MFMPVRNFVNMYIHVCTMYRDVCTDLPSLVQVIRIPDASYIPPDRTSRTATSAWTTARSLWLGTSRSKESDADLSGVERVEGGGYGEQNRDGPGSTKMCRCGKVALFTAMTHVIDWDTEPLRDAPL